MSFDLEDGEDSATILMLKEQLSIAANIEQLTPNNQKWIYKGKVLADENTLVMSGFTAGDTIHVMATATTATATAAAAPIIAQQPGYFPVPQFDQAMGNLLSMHSSSTDISPSLSTVYKIISNIIKNPHEEKYRKIKSSNNLIQKKIVSIPGALNVLLATGFAPSGEDYVIMVSPTAWEVLVTCQRKLDLFLKKLEQTPPAETKTPSLSEPESSASQKSLPLPPTPSTSSTASSMGTEEGSEQTQQHAAMQQFLLALAATATTTTSANSATTSDDNTSITEVR